MPVDYRYADKCMKPILVSEGNIRRIVDNELSFHQFHNAYLITSEDTPLYTGAYDENGSFIELSYFHEGLPHEQDLPASKMPTELMEKTIFIGTINKMFGHFFTDGLKKLWFLQTQKGKELLKNGYIVSYISSWETPPKYAIDLLKLLGLDLLSFIQIKESCRVNDLIIPDNAMIYCKDKGRFINQQYISTINTIINNLPINNSLRFDKLYFTRTALNNTRDYNERELEKILTRLGFKIVSPEKFSIIDQLSMLQNCQEFATTYGSLSHEILFCKPNTKVAILTKSIYNNSYQTAIDQVKPLNISYVKAHHSWPWVSHHGPFFLCCTRKVRRYFGYKGFSWDFFCWSFVRYSLAIAKIYYHRLPETLKKHLHIR